MTAAGLERSYPLTLAALEAGTQLPDGVGDVVGAGVRVCVIEGEPGSLRRVDCWSADSGFVIHPFMGDTDAPSSTTVLDASGRASAVARLVGRPGGAEASGEELLGDVRASAPGLVERAVEHAESPDGALRAVWVTVADPTVADLVVVHDGGTRWARSHGEEPVELVTGAYDGLWSAACELFRL